MRLTHGPPHRADVLTAIKTILTGGPYRPCGIPPLGAGEITDAQAALLNWNSVAAR